MEPVISAVVPVFLTVALGYWFGKHGKPFDTPTVTFLASTVSTPALIVSSLLSVQASGAHVLEVAAATLLCVALFVIVGYAIVRALGLEPRVYLPSLSFPNTGNLGLPLALYAFGQTGLGYAATVFSMVAICNFIVGQMLAAGRSNWMAALKTPTTPAAILGILGASLHVELPQWLSNVMTLLGGLAIPLMLLMLGTSLAKIGIRGSKRAAGIGALRIVMGGLVGFAVALLFGFSGVERAVLVLQCAMPVAVYNYLFAVVWKTDPQEVASIVVASTLMALVTIPALLAILI